MSRKTGKTNENLEDQEAGTNPKKGGKDGVNSRAKEISKVNAQEVEANADEDFESINLSEEDKKKLDDLCHFLNMSQDLMLKTAISYVLRYAKTLRNTSVKELNGYQSCLGSNKVKIELGLKEKTLLEQQDLIKSVSECAVLGIKLMHMSLIESKRIG